VPSQITKWLCRWLYLKGPHKLILILYSPIVGSINMAKDTQILTYAQEGGVGLDIDRYINTL